MAVSKRDATFGRWRQRRGRNLPSTAGVVRVRRELLRCVLWGVGSCGVYEAAAMSEMATRLDPKKAENSALLFDAAVDDMFNMDISLKNISWIHMTSVFAVNCEEISPEAGWTSQDPIILMGCIWHLPRFCYLVDHIQGSKTKASASEGNGWKSSELIRTVTSPEWTP